MVKLLLKQFSVLSVAWLGILLLQEVASSNYTLYPRDYADIPCSLAQNEEGVCVYAYLCQEGVVNTDGAGVMDLRFGEDVCEDYFLRCCSKHTPCEDGRGTCVAKDKCGVDTNKPKYKKFRSSQDCDWSGYICCPTEAVGSVGEATTTKTTTKTTTRPTTSPTTTKKPVKPDNAGDLESCDDDSSICVPPTECAANTDGSGLIQERMGTCSALEHVCCPKELVRSKDGCSATGGTCVPENQCASKIEFDVRMQESPCPTAGHVCCTETNETGGAESVGKDCLRGKGKCMKKCNGPKFTDRKNECDKLLCCAIETVTPTPTPRPITTTTSTEPAWPTCEESGGTCSERSACHRVSEQLVQECQSIEHVCCSEEIEKPTVVGGGDDSYVSKGCGHRNELGVVFKTINNREGESQYGEFPWVVGVFAKSGAEYRFVCGGTLIDPEVVLTTADCVQSFRSKLGKLTIRAGEWDMRSAYEPIPHQERDVRSFKIHPSYKQSSLVNNIALLFLDDKFDQVETIDTACLPPQNFEIQNGHVTATGWGSTPTNRTQKQQILKSLELPFNQRSECEQILRRALRKPSFKLDPSFLCAGGYPDEDTCMGDAGSPIMFPITDDFDGRWYVVGMVSWGIGCGRMGVPAAYTDVGRFRDWIDSELRKEGLAMYYYDYQPQEKE